jgi:hypothetical protein
MALVQCTCCLSNTEISDNEWVSRQTAQEALQHLIRCHDDRVSELLRHNNELLERCRAADRETIVAREVARKAIIVAGEIAKTLPEGKL